MDQVLGAALALGGLVVGAGLNMWRDRLTWRRERGLDAADRVVQVLDQIWADRATHPEFDVTLRKLTLTLELLSVRAEVVEELNAAARVCRLDSERAADQGDVDQHGEPIYWIDVVHLDRLDHAIRAAIGDLKRLTKLTMPQRRFVPYRDPVVDE